MQVTVMGFVIMYKGHVKYIHFQTFQAQILYWMIIEIKDALNYNIKPVCLLFFGSNQEVTITKDKKKTKHDMSDERFGFIWKHLMKILRTTAKPRRWL